MTRKKPTAPPDRTPTPCPSLGYVRASLAAVGRAGTQEAEARASGVTRLTWGRWERGVGRGGAPPRDAVAAIAARWGVRVADLEALPGSDTRERFDSGLREARARISVRALIAEHGPAAVRSAVRAELRARI